MDSTRPPLSADIVDAFRRDGYVPYGPVVGGAALEELRGALTELQRGWAAELGVSVDEYTRVVSQWTNVWERHPRFAMQLRDPIVTAVAASLLDCARVRVFHDHVISKPPGASSEVPWHQDYPYWPVNSPRALSCWLALDDVTPATGCLHFMPGAHLAGERAPIDFLNDRTEWGERAPTPAPIPAGWCVFHSCLSWHMTPANTTASERRAYIAILMDADCTYAPDHAAWHPMNKRATVVPGAPFNDDVFPVVGGR